VGAASDLCCVARVAAAPRELEAGAPARDPGLWRRAGGGVRHGRGRRGGGGPRPGEAGRRAAAARGQQAAHCAGARPRLPCAAAAGAPRCARATRLPASLHPCAAPDSGARQQRPPYLTGRQQTRACARRAGCGADGGGAAGADAAPSAPPYIPTLTLTALSRQGYKAQSGRVVETLERLVAACEARRESLVVEGVHLTLNFVVRLMQRHPSIVPFLIHISNEAKHRERFAVRAARARPRGRRLSASPGRAGHAVSLPGMLHARGRRWRAVAPRKAQQRRRARAAPRAWRDGARARAAGARQVHGAGAGAESVRAAPALHPRDPGVPGAARGAARHPARRQHQRRPQRGRHSRDSVRLPAPPSARAAPLRGGASVLRLCPLL